MKLVFGLFLCLCFAIAGHAQSGRNKSGDQNGEQSNDRETEPKEDKPVKILSKEPPDSKVFKLCLKRYGVTFVRTAVRATFDKTGEITAAEIYAASECREFDAEGVRVAQKIKFQPAVKNGEAVTVTKIVVYEGGIL